MDVDFRRVNVDQYDEDKLDSADLFEPFPSQDSSAVAQQVRQMISRGEANNALGVALGTFDPSPALSLLSSIKSADIATVLSTLTDDQLDLLMRAVYKGMAEPATNNCAVLLNWHEKIVEKGGEGVIVRVLTDKRQ